MHGKHLLLGILVQLVVLLVKNGNQIYPLPMVEIRSSLMLTEAGPTLLWDQDLGLFHHDGRMVRCIFIRVAVSMPMNVARTTIPSSFDHLRVEVLLCREILIG
jgi:hypothetical protein